MSLKRGFAEGVLNIVRFNWPFFAGAAFAGAVLLVVALVAHSLISLIALICLVLLLIGMVVPLLVSFYVYDLSGLYEMSFLYGSTPGKVLNLTAGFDETTKLLRANFPQAEVLTLDFYDPKDHTESSIRRARKLFPLPKEVLSISTSEIPLPDGDADLILGFLSLHELRDETERTRFLREAKRTLAASGSIMIIEHLRDLPNFLAYSIGFLHFHSRRTWLEAFTKADLKISDEQCLTPFIRIFKLTHL